MGRLFVYDENMTDERAKSQLLKWPPYRTL